MWDIKLHISAVKQPFSISVLENLLSYEGLSDVTDILTFGCFYSQTQAVNVEQDGLAVAKRQKSCFVYNNYVNVQLIDY